MNVINQKTVLAALELCGGRVLDDAHHKAAEILNERLIDIPGQTLGDKPPHISRLFPALETLERQGLIRFVRTSRKRYSLIELVHQPTLEIEPDVSEPSEAEGLIIKALGDLGGSVDDASGQVTVTLRELVGEGINRTQWRQNLEDTEHHGWIRRTIENGRAIRIELTDDAAAWYRARYGETDILVPVHDPEPIEELPVAVAAVPSPSLDDEAFAEKVAFKLLDEVIMRAKKPYVDPDENERITKELEKVYEKLAQAKEERRVAEAARIEAEQLFRVADDENKRMSKQVDELQETITDIAHERDEWRKKYGQMEVQLSALTPSDKKRKMGQELKGLIADDD
jgi:hypothetical protein